jgi:1-deoxy-D-xylulose-5-phosphate reductoisomerase
MGSTGSIGRQALQVIDANPDYFDVEVLTAFNNAELLIRQAIDHQPNAVVIGNGKKYDLVNEALSHRDIKVYTGTQALDDVVEMESIDIVLAALVGFAGLSSTIKAIRAGKQIALANKETLVVAGEYITHLARERGVNIYPVDYEHSAIFQCMVGEFQNAIERIILTASGGPFRGKTRVELKNVDKAEALKHPNWDMGDKITIDSATLMNKGLEVIEAKWLFNLNHDQIEVVVHPQSIVHSLVEFKDGSIKAQMGIPDMRIPIQFALSYPNRLKSFFPKFSFADYPVLNFERPDMGTFRNLAFAYEALKKGGNVPCILNAANEIAVDAFLKDKINFLQISDVIETCLQQVSFVASPDLKDYFETDKETRIKAKEIIK